MEDRLGRLEDDIDLLRKRMATPGGDIRDQIDRGTRDLRSKVEAVRERIRAVEAVGASTWGRLKSSVDEGLKKLGKIVDEAVERFQ